MADGNIHHFRVPREAPPPEQQGGRPPLSILSDRVSSLLLFMRFGFGCSRGRLESLDSRIPKGDRWTDGEIFAIQHALYAASHPGEIVNVNDDVAMKSLLAAITATPVPETQIIVQISKAA